MYGRFLPHTHDHICPTNGTAVLSGSQEFKGFSSGSRTYTLTCSNSSDSTSRSVTVQIGYGFDLPLC